MDVPEPGTPEDELSAAYINRIREIAALQKRVAELERERDELREALDNIRTRVAEYERAAQWHRLDAVRMYVSTFTYELLQALVADIKASATLGEDADDDL